jgi:hypothetical protein
MATGPTALDIVTLIIAILWFALAVATLAWQVVTWLYEGARVKVKHSFAFLTFGPELSEQMLLITAVNVGRSPIEITGWGIDVGGGTSLFVSNPIPGSTPLPTTVDGGHHAKFFMELAEHERAVKRAAGPKPPRPYVSLGTDKKVKGKVISLKHEHT